MYGGEEFEKEVQDYIAMVDHECEKSDDVTLQRMQDHFIKCCQLEYMFWDQATTKMIWPV
jgi:thiaminase (transcriptional activator TenA)